MKIFIYKLLIILFLTSTTNSAQELVAEKGSFGIDTKNKIIVWHVFNLDSILKVSKNIKSIKFNESFRIQDLSTKNLSYTNSISLSNGNSYKLYISKLPIIHLDVNTSELNSRNKILGSFTFFYKTRFLQSHLGIRYRGNLSLSFSKKSFDLEFWKDKVLKQSKDVKFEGLRSDDDWVLDAMFNEPLRLRSFIAANLWTQIHQPYYKSKEPEAKSGFGVKYVEVFKNNEYYGVYQLSESVDRKQLKLKKSKNKTIYGELYKADSYEGGPSFEKAPKEYSNLLGNWNGWAMRYPFIDNQPNWKNLAEFSNLVVKEPDDYFIKNIATNFNIANAIDYYLFVNILGATDNLGKNYYLAKYTKNKPYFIVPWDLDGSWGVIQDGKEQYNTDKILDNSLLRRLIVTNPDNYKQKLKNRWSQLRLKEFSDKNLFAKIDEIYTQFSEEKIYEREFLVWQNKYTRISKEKHYQHLKWWLEKKLNFLDNYFNNL